VGRDALREMHVMQRPNGLHRLIIQSSPSSMVIRDGAEGGLHAKLAQHVQDALCRHEATGATIPRNTKELLSSFLPATRANYCKTYSGGFAKDV
jgi:hypothetical protein